MKKLRAIRLRKGYSLRGLAEEIDVHFSLISRWEKGGRVPKNKKIIQRLTETLDTPLEVLFQDATEEEVEFVKSHQTVNQYHQSL